MPAADTLRLQLVRNATIRLSVGSRTLLIDPYLADAHMGISYAGAERSPLVPLPFPIAQVLDGVDAVFISHLHSDHFDETARQVLPRDLPILCPAILEEALSGLGFSDVTGIKESLSWFGTRFHLTSGRHGPDAVLEEMGTVNGFVAATSGLPTLYWVGDSIWCPEVRETIDRLAPEVIVVHACGASWKGEKPLVMDEEHVASLMRHAPTARVVALHLDCVDHATVSRADLSRHFEPLASMRSRLAIPADGQIVTLGGG